MHLLKNIGLYPRENTGNISDKHTVLLQKQRDGAPWQPPPGQQQEMLLQLSKKQSLM